MKMLTQSILITGCNKGIGLELVRQLAQHKERPHFIFATCRNPESATELNQIAKSCENVHIFQLDVTDYKSFAHVRDEVSKVVGDLGLNVLFNNAGTSFPDHTVESLNPEQLMKAYQVNAIGPAMMAQTFLPLLRQASARRTEESCMSIKRAAILNMTALTGSLSDNGSGGLYPSRMSRAGTHMLTKNLSIELNKDGILAVALHPGWVKTDQGGPNAKWEVDFCVSKFMELLPNLNAEHSGNVYWCDGRLISW